MKVHIVVYDVLDCHAAMVARNLTTYDIAPGARIYEKEPGSSLRTIMGETIDLTEIANGNGLAVWLHSIGVMKKKWPGTAWVMVFE